MDEYDTEEEEGGDEEEGDDNEEGGPRKRQKTAEKKGKSRGRGSPVAARGLGTTDDVEQHRGVSEDVDVD